MDEHGREITGFLCRWCVLMLATAIALGATVLAVRAVAAAPAETRDELMLPDAILRPPPAGQEALIPCMVKPGALSGVQLLWEAGDGIAREGHQPIWWYLRYWNPPAQGRVNIRLMGNPFCTVGLKEAHAAVQMSPLPRDLYLLDARLAVGRIGANKAQMKGVLAEMSRLGDAAFVTPGGFAEMLPLRARLRAAGFLEPVLCDIEPKSSADVLMHTRWGLRMRAGRLVLISDDAAFVQAALADGDCACLVDGPVVENSQRLWQFPSLTNLKDWLARQPISK